jgi:hypothetical protein
MEKVKQYPRKFKLCWNGELGIEWGQSERTLGTNHYFYYFKVGLLDKEMRDAYREFKEDSHIRKVFGFQNFGLHKFWYDCPHAQLNLFFIVFYWSTYWTNMPKDYWDRKKSS